MLLSQSRVSQILLNLLINIRLQCPPKHRKQEHREPTQQLLNYQIAKHLVQHHRKYNKPINDDEQVLLQT